MKKETKPVHIHNPIRASYEIVREKRLIDKPSCENITLNQKCNFFQKCVLSFKTFNMTKEILKLIFFIH